jgi:hypothetical protein
VSATGGWGRAGSGGGERGRASNGPLGPPGRKGGAGVQERERGFRPEMAQPRGGVFSFFFF